MNQTHHIKWLIVTESGLTLVSILMSNDDLDMEGKSDVWEDTEANVGEDLNGEDVYVSDVVPVSVKFPMGSDVTLVRNFSRILWN